MPQLRQSIEDNVYYIKDDSDKVLLSIKLDEGLRQITLSTDKEVYSGPIELIRFAE